MQCSTVPGIGSRLYFIVNVLGQPSLASEVYLSYANPKIGTLEANTGPTSGQLRLRVTGTNYAILDKSVQKFISWFDGDREIMVNIAAQPGFDYQLTATEGDTSTASASSWVAFDQPQGYGSLNDVSVVLLSLETGVRVQSLPVHFSYDAPVIARVFPEEPYDCAVKINKVYVGMYDGKNTDITIVLGTPKALLNGSKVQINGWKGTYNNTDSGDVTETAFLSDVFIVSDVDFLTDDSNMAQTFHVKYGNRVPAGITTVDAGTCQVRRNGIRLKIEGSNFCSLSSHPAASPSCGRVVIAANTLSTAEPDLDLFTIDSIREVCSHTHESIELLSFSTKGHVRIETWDIDLTAILNPLLPVSTTAGQYLMSNNKFFDQQTPQLDGHFRKRLRPQRYIAKTMETKTSSLGFITVNLGQMSSDCIVKGTTVTFENAVEPRLNGPHVIDSLPSDSSNLDTLFIIASNIIINPGEQIANSLVVACPTFQTHGVDVLTFSGQYWPQNADLLEILIGDTYPVFDTDATDATDASAVVVPGDIVDGGRRRLDLSRRLAVNVTKNNANQLVMDNYLRQLSEGRTGTKCVLTPECRAEANFAEDNKCLKLVVDASSGQRTFTVSCTVPSGCGINHPVVINRLGVKCDFEDSNGDPITTKCADNVPENLATLSSLSSLSRNPLLAYSTPVVTGMYQVEGNAQDGYTCDTSIKLILSSSSADPAVIPPVQTPQPPLRIRSPTEGNLICIRGKNFGNDINKASLHVGRWSNDFPAYQKVLSHKAHANGADYDQMIVHIPPGDGEGPQNQLSLDIASIVWPYGHGGPTAENTAENAAWWSLNVQYKEPRIISVEPKVGPAQGFAIVMTGTNFGPQTNPLLPKIRIKPNGAGSNSANEYSCTVLNRDGGNGTAMRDHTSITCQLDRGVGKDLDVSIVVNGQEHTLSKAVSYAPPVVVSVQPLLVHTNGGDNVTVSGINFGNVKATINLLTSTLNHPDIPDIQVDVSNIVQWTDTVIIFKMPEGFGTSFRVQVTAGKQNSNSDKRVGYMVPFIQNITLGGGRKPCATMIRNEECGAPTSGGFLVNLVGSNFADQQSLAGNPKLFEVVLSTNPPSSMGWCGAGQTISCVQADQHSHNVLRLYMPAGTGTNNLFTIRVGNQKTNALAKDGESTFSYDPPWINAITPREGNAGSIGNPDGNIIKIQGINFGSPNNAGSLTSTSSGILDKSVAESNAVRVFIGGKVCENAVKLQESGRPPHIECKTQRDQVGFKSVFIFAANQNVTYSSAEWECDSNGLCGGEFKGGKKLFMMQCEDSTYGLFGEWCVDCPHVTDAVTSASSDPLDEKADSDVGGGCGAGSIGSDVCLKPVLRNGELDYIAKCPTGSARFELPPGSKGEAYEASSIYDTGICSSPDAAYLDENVRLACAPFPNAGFYKYYTNSTDTSDDQVATSRCHSLRQPPGGVRKSCSYVVSCEPRDACFENNVCALDDNDEEFLWSGKNAYELADFVMIGGDRSQMYICRAKEGCRRGLDPIEEWSNRLKEESAAITSRGTSDDVTEIGTSVEPEVAKTKWMRSAVRGIWKSQPVGGLYLFGDIVYHKLNASMGDETCDDPNDMGCPYEVSVAVACLLLLLLLLLFSLFLIFVHLFHFCSIDFFFFGSHLNTMDFCAFQQMLTITRKDVIRREDRPVNFLNCGHDCDPNIPITNVVQINHLCL